MVDVVLLPSDVDKKAASADKKGWPLQQREKRFQILGFLVTVDAATRQEIADQLKTTKKNVEGILSHNSHYFESFRIPYDKQYRWRATEKGKQDYFDIVNETKAATKVVKAIRGRPSIAHIKILNMLAVGNYMTHTEITALSGLSRAYSFHILKNLLNSNFVEKVLYNGRCYYWRITDSGRQEYSRLEQIHGPIAITLSAQEIEDRDVLVQQCLSKMKIREQEGKVIESFKTEKKIRSNESGLRKYFLYDENNPIDMEIVKRVNKHPRPEYHCKKIMCKRLPLHCGASYRDVDQVIEIKLLDRCKEKGITRNEFVRQLFCIYFNIKMKATS